MGPPGGPGPAFFGLAAPPLPGSPAPRSRLRPGFTFPHPDGIKDPFRADAVPPVERTISYSVTEVQDKMFKTRVGILALGLGLALVTAAAGQEAAGQARTEQTLMEFEGTVQHALGKYLYLPSASGFDVALQGFDAAALVGKDVRIKGEPLTDKPSILRADSVEVKDASGLYTNAFTRTGDLVLEDFLSLDERRAYEPLAVTGAAKPEEWEGKETGKIFGEYVAGENDGNGFIVLKDDRDRESARIIVDGMSEYARYYLGKLRLFDKYWFYVDVKDSVERRERTRTKQIFHADVIFCGLF